jgi:hypothetical protein
MDKNPDKTEGNKSLFISPDEVIREVSESIESVDRKIKKFYEIHATELQVTPDNRPHIRRKK